MKYTAADINLDDKRTATVGIAYALTALTKPAKSEDPEEDAKAIIAHIFNTFDTFGIDLVVRGDKDE